MDDNKNMRDQDSKFKKWYKEHKKAFWFGVGSICTIIGGTAAYMILTEGRKNVEFKSDFTLVDHMDKELLINKSCEIVSNIEEETREYNLEKTNIVYDSFVRNLPKGKHHSQEKIEEAKALGILLEDNQTLVSEYIKNKVA